MKELCIGILRETKDPPDRRVPLSPFQCRKLMDENPGLQILVEPSRLRCFSDEEYSAQGIELKEDLSSCQVLLGVKEVKIPTLIQDKTYLFFSHTAKMQPYNRGLLQAVMDKGIRLVDYEYLTDEAGIRVVAFGRWAGVVGAYNGLRAIGQRYGSFELPAAGDCHDLKELLAGLGDLDFGSSRMVVTGGGRVAGGALEILRSAGIREVSPAEYLERGFNEAIFTRLDPWHYTLHPDREEFEFGHFTKNPGEYRNNFLPYARKSDVFIACHFWDPASPVLLTREDLASGDIPIGIVADISCDIDGPIASTIRASTIAEPFYGYDPATGEERNSFRKDVISVMAVDNLPGELPRDASMDFGEALSKQVIPELLGKSDTGMLWRASITDGGNLTREYAYLQAYLEGIS